MPAREEIFSAAERLHAHLLRRHLSRGLLRGPDSGVRFNLRAGRFLKSLLSSVPWRDNYAFMQTQGYWTLSNWMMFEASGGVRHRELALAATEAALGLQRSEGSWAYPLPERKGLIATVEGNWAALALLASHAREPRAEYLAGAVRWYDFLVDRIGFQPHGRSKAVNYFDRPRGKVPNNSVEAAWFFLRLWRATGEGHYLEHVEPLLDFIAGVQLPSGEIPYIVEGPYERARDHYLCFQYNAFQYLKLVWSRAVRPSAAADSILTALARFLKTGVQSSGACAADCSSRSRGGPEVDYYTAALAAALRDAAELGDNEARDLSERSYARVLRRQRPDGSFGFSTGDYGFLRDSRSYPRPQAMTLFHLLYGCGLGDGFGITGNS